jgi:hypothetical protein
LSTSCNRMLLFYQVATRLSLTTCWQVVELQDDNKLLEQLVASILSSTTFYSKLSTSRWQLVNKLGTSSANTCWWQVVGTALLQVCCRFVTTCAFLCVYSSRTCMPAFRRMRFMFILAFIQASHHKAMTPLTHLYRWRNMSRTVLFPPSCCKPSRR